MNSFSISQLAQFAGVKPHTIRMWEQRYNGLKPTRSQGNTRHYDNNQLRRLLNIVSLSKGEHKVSALCAMTDKKLFTLIEEMQATAMIDSDEFFVSQLIVAGMSYNELYFEKTLSLSLLKYGMKDTYLKVIYPMMVRVGLMWSSDSIPPAHEHFISNLVRQKLYTAIGLLPPPKPDAQTWMLCLPENELHEIGLLFACYLIRVLGGKAIYLGANLPIDSLKEALKCVRPSNLLLFFVRNDFPENMSKYLKALNHHFAGKNIFVAGSGLDLSVIKSKKIQFLQSVGELEYHLNAAKVV